MAVTTGSSAQRITQASSGEVINAGEAHSFTRPTCGIIANASGLMHVVLSDDNSAVIINASGGSIYPLNVKSIPSSNAIQVVALYNTR